MRKKTAHTHEPDVNWTPARDSTLRFMWANSWSYNIENIAERFLTTTSAVVRRARDLKLPPRPNAGGGLGRVERMADVKARWRAAADDRVRRAKLNWQQTVIHVVTPSGAVVRDLTPELRALVDASLRAWRPQRDKTDVAVVPRPRNRARPRGEHK